LTEPTSAHRVPDYLLVLALFIGATLLRSALDPLLGTQSPYTAYLALVVVVTWFCGGVWGTFTSGAAALAGDYFFVEPRFTLGGVGSSGMVMFAATAIALVVLVSRWKAAEQTLRHSKQRPAIGVARARHSPEGWTAPLRADDGAARVGTPRAPAPAVTTGRLSG